MQSNLPRSAMDMADFSIQDKSVGIINRTPLQNGRTLCENQSPTDTLTCTFAYGEGLTFSRTLQVRGMVTVWITVDYGDHPTLTNCLLWGHRGGSRWTSTH
jgi:hypothetical protein